MVKSGPSRAEGLFLNLTLSKCISAFVISSASWAAVCALSSFHIGPLTHLLIWGSCIWTSLSRLPVRIFSVESLEKMNLCGYESDGNDNDVIVVVDDDDEEKGGGRGQGRNSSNDSDGGHRSS